MNIQWSDDGLGDDLIVTWGNRQDETITVKLDTEVMMNGDDEEYNHIDASALTTEQIGEVVFFMVECGCVILEHPNPQVIAWDYWSEEYD